MTHLIDAGALIALDRGDRTMWRRLADALQTGHPPRTHGGIVGQVWRNGAQQARLARVLRSLDVVGLDHSLGRRAGELLARAGTADVVDAALIALARDGDIAFTTDVADLTHLARTSGVHVEIVPV